MWNPNFSHCERLLSPRATGIILNESAKKSLGTPFLTHMCVHACVSTHTHTLHCDVKAQILPLAFTPSKY